MSKDFTIEFRDDCIYVRHATIELRPEDTDKLWAALAAGYNAYHCRRVLIEGDLVWRKSNWMGAYSSATQAMDVIQGLRVAYFVENYKEDELTEFFKMVATNRGVSIEFFSDRQKALGWLG